MTTDTPQSLHAIVCASLPPGTREPKFATWQRDYQDFLNHDYTGADLQLVLRHIRASRNKWGSGSGYSANLERIFDCEYKRFDALLVEASAENRNRRPAPTPKEQVIALRDPLSQSEEAQPRANGQGRHITDVFKNITNQ